APPRAWRAPGDGAIPIVTTLAPRILGGGPWGIATAVEVPWDDGAAEEGVCLAADMCVGPPVAAALADCWVPHPNPDLSLRFVPTEAGREYVGIGRLAEIAGGLAGVE
ncbi:MAG: hypothetical protein C4344_06070, partial [Acidimicrobiia bacterium]